MAAYFGRASPLLILTLLTLFPWLGWCSFTDEFVLTISQYAFPVPKSAYNVTRQKEVLDALWSFIYLEDTVVDEVEYYLSWNQYWNPKERTKELKSIESEINAQANTSFPNNETYHNYGSTLVSPAYNDTQYDLADRFSSAIQNLSVSINELYYSFLGNYLGVGINATCQNYISAAIDGTTLYDQAGANAATTLMGIIPALLTFGNLYVARSSEAFGTSFLVGALSALFSLGLPVRSISGVAKKQTIAVASFDYFAQVAINSIGKLRGRDRKTGLHFKVKEKVHLDELQSYAPNLQRDNLGTNEEKTGRSFSKLRHQAKNKWAARAHFWRIPALFVAATQVVIFLFAIGPLFMGPGTPLLIFDCSQYVTSLYLLVSALISSLFRFIMWEKGNHERVKIYSLTDRSIDELRNLCLGSERFKVVNGFRQGTTETEMPPLYPPLLLRFQQLWFRLLGNKLKTAVSIVSNYTANSIRRLAGVSTVELTQDTDENPQEYHSHTSLRHHARAIFKTVSTLLFYPIKNIQNARDMLFGGFLGSRAKDSARRWRPLVVLLHLSTTGRHPLVTLFTGAVEGTILVVLTFFFSAQWGGNLLITFYSMVILLVAVTIGRALGIWYVWRSAKEFGLHVIECESTKQIRGCLRILCSMKDVLVYVNGAWYFEGYRVDNAESWHAWKKNYISGKYDEPEPQSTELGNININKTQEKKNTKTDGGSSTKDGDDAAVTTTVKPVARDGDSERTTLTTSNRSIRSI